MLCAGGDGIACASTVHTAGFVTWGSIGVLLIKRYRVGACPKHIVTLGLSEHS